MLSLLDVIDYCDLNRCEIDVIAEHEHIPVALAAEMSAVLVCTEEGVCRLHSMFLENMQHALEIGRVEHAQELMQSYADLQRRYPLITH